MKKSIGWTEAQVKDTVNEYFRLMRKQAQGIPFVKVKAYRRLREIHPERSEGAFESKFQNISAVLHARKFPYLKGLKPRDNVQKMLRAFVAAKLVSEGMLSIN